MFTPSIVITGIDEDDFKKFQAAYGYRATLAVKWSWNGEIIPVEDFNEIDKMENDESYAEKVLCNNNLRI